MSINYAWVETGHPNCRRPDKVIDARHQPNTFVKNVLLAIKSLVGSST